MTMSRMNRFVRHPESLDESDRYHSDKHPLAAKIANLQVRFAGVVQTLVPTERALDAGLAASINIYSTAERRLVVIKTDFWKAIRIGILAAIAMRLLTYVAHMVKSLIRPGR